LGQRRNGRKARGAGYWLADDLPYLGANRKDKIGKRKEMAGLCEMLIRVDTPSSTVMDRSRGKKIQLLGVYIILS